MKIYTCPVSGDEVISDSFKFTEVDDVVYEVDCAWTTKGGAINVDTGANASAEGGGDDEGTDDAAVPVIDAIDNHNLEEAAFLKDKKEYGAALKKYFKKVKEIMKEKQGKTDEEIKEWEKKAGAYAKDNILAKEKFKDLEMYITEHGMDYITPDTHPIVILLNYRDGEDGSKAGGNPYLIIWKAALGEQKL